MYYTQFLCISVYIFTYRNASVEMLGHCFWFFVTPQKAIVYLLGCLNVSVPTDCESPSVSCQSWKDVCQLIGDPETLPVLVYRGLQHTKVPSSRSFVFPVFPMETPTETRRRRPRRLWRPLLLRCSSKHCPRTPGCRCDHVPGRFPICLSMFMGMWPEAKCRWLMW